MRILFFPYYYYLQYEPFLPVIKSLNADGIDAQLIYIPNISPKDETMVYHPDRFQQDGVPFQEFRLRRFRRSNDMSAPLFQLLQYIINYQRLKTYIRHMKPDGVVIGSHLGGIYIRTLQIICHSYSIPCFCFWGIEVHQTDHIKLPAYFPLPRLIKSTLCWLPTNEYTKTHRFAVSGNALKRHLLAHGIPQSQIVVTGNPAHDQIHRNIGSKPSIETGIGFPKGTYIVFLSEVVQDVLGLDYLIRLLKSLYSACDVLPADIRVVVKFHPRETEQTRALHRTILAGERYAFFENTDLVQLIRGAALSIGCFTKALETSFILGVPVLSLNYTGKNEYSIIYPTDKTMECANPDALKTKLAAFFSDPAFRNAARQVVKEWLVENVCAIDGQNTKRMADAIITHVGQHGGKI